MQRTEHRGAAQTDCKDERGTSGASAECVLAMPTPTMPASTGSARRSGAAMAGSANEAALAASRAHLTAAAPAMATPKPAFAVSDLAPLAKTMPREEYMRLVMSAFQDAKRKKEEEASSKKRAKPEPLPRGPGDYGDELRAMLYTFGAARGVDVDVLVRLEGLAKAFVKRLCARLAAEVSKEEEARQAKKEGGPRGAARREGGASARRGGRARRRTAAGEGEGEADGDDTQAAAGAAAAADAAGKTEGAAEAASESGAGKRVLRLDHVARVLESAEEVQRLADVVAALRRRRQEKLRQSLDNEAEAEGELFPRAMLEAAAGAVGEVGGGATAAAAAAAGGVLSEAFWAEHGVNERVASAVRLRRLQRRDELTRALTASEYLEWAECAKVSFTKPQRRKKFAAWAGLGEGGAFAASKELTDVLGQLTYEHVEAHVAAAVARKAAPLTAFPLLTAADLPPLPSSS